MPTNLKFRTRVRVFLFAFICAVSLAVAFGLVTAGAAGDTITVNSISEAANSADGLCTLREAIIAANTNTASGAVAGECAAGSADGPTTLWAHHETSR